MPYINKPDDEELKKQQEAQAGNPTSISGQSAVLSTDAPSNKGGAKESGSYTNLNQYLDANKQSADIMGANIADKVQTNAESAKAKTQQLGSAVSEVKEFDPTNIYSNITSLSEDDKQRYKTAKQGYAGPQSLGDVSGYADAQKQVSKAYQDVSNAGNEQGQRQLLKDNYARPTYSQGQNSLDQMLLQNSAGSKQRFENLTSNYSGINKDFENASQSLGNRITNNITTGNANQQRISAGDVQARKNLIDPIQARAAAMNSNNAALAGRVYNDIADDTLAQETIDQLGLAEGTNLYGTNLANYLTQDLSNVGLDNAANAEERAKYAALTSLIDGKQGTEITAEGRQIKPVSFDAQRFATDQAKQKAELDALLAATDMSAVGEYGDEYKAGKYTTTANANVARYLANKDDIQHNTRLTGGMNLGGGSGYGTDAGYAVDAAKANLYKKIDDFLNQNNYNRKIKKG